MASRSASPHGPAASLTLLAPVGDGDRSGDDGRLRDLLDRIRTTVPDGVEADTIEPTSADASHVGFVLTAPDPADLGSWVGDRPATDVIGALGAAGERPLTIISQGADPPDGLPVSYVVTYRVPAARRASFQAWQPKIIAAHLRAPGFVSAEYHPPTDDDTTWTVLVRFATDTELATWRNSSRRTELIGQLEGIVDDLAVRQTGLSWAGWFPEPQAPTRPARWKQAVATVVPLYPTVMLATIHLAPRLGEDGWGWPRWLVTFIVVSTAVATLTWVLMPAVTRILQPWLLPPPDQPAAVTSGWTVAVLTAVAALVAAFAFAT